jgi:carboxypeptidase Taq
VLWTRLVRDCVTSLPNGRGDLADFIRSHREELVLKPNRAYGGSGVHLGSLVTSAEWDTLIEEALAQQNHPHNSWVVQSVATLPVHEFPIVGEDGRAHTEPFYAVMGFAATDHGLGIICRVSQKQVVNVAQRGGLAPVLVAQQPRNLRAPHPAAIDANRARALLREEIRRLKQLDSVLRVLEWDEETYRPSGAEAQRASQLAVIETLRHELLSAERLADLIETVGADCSTTEPLAAELLELKRLRRSALALPPELVSAFAAARSHALAAWEEAFRKDDYALFAGPFEHLLGLLRERAQALQQTEDLYDALLDEHEPGMTRAELTPLLETTGGRLRELVPKLAELTRGARQPVTRGTFDADTQSRFCRALIGDMGFDFTRGRLDRSTHPFTLMASENDVRITLRYAGESPVSAIMAALHEGGHGLYDQGFPAVLHDTLLATAPSSGMHECQARLWENHVGRSLSFWSFYFPRLAQWFPQQLAGTDVASFHAALNVVAPGANRVAADEVTYDLHILLRYELELALLNKDLEVADLPAAWRERSQHHLGVVPRNDREGCLQDVHWSLGEFGYFPTYTIGNLYAAALVEAYAQSADLDEELSRGELAPLRSWLAKHVYGLGCALRAPAIIQAATGHSLTPEPFFRLLNARFAQ